MVFKGNIDEVFNESWWLKVAFEDTQIQSVSGSYRQYSWVAFRGGIHV